MADNILDIFGNTNNEKFALQEIAREQSTNEITPQINNNIESEIFKYNDGFNYDESILKYIDVVEDLVCNTDNNISEFIFSSEFMTNLPDNRAGNALVSIVDSYSKGFTNILEENLQNEDILIKQSKANVRKVPLKLPEQVKKRKKKKSNFITRRFNVDCIFKKIKNHHLDYLMKFIMNIIGYKINRLEQTTIENMTIEFNKLLYSMTILEIYKKDLNDKCDLLNEVKNIKVVKQFGFGQKILKKYNRSKWIYENLVTYSLNTKNILGLILKTKLSDFILKYYNKSSYYKNHLRKVVNWEKLGDDIEIKYYFHYEKLNGEFFEYLNNSIGNKKKKKIEGKKY